MPQISTPNLAISSQQTIVGSQVCVSGKDGIGATVYRGRQNRLILWIAATGPSGGGRYPNPLDNDRLHNGLSAFLANGFDFRLDFCVANVIGR